MYRILNVIKTKDPVLWSIIGVIVICCGIFIYQDYQGYQSDLKEKQKFQQQLRDEYRNQIMQEFNRRNPRPNSPKNVPRTYIL